MAAPPGTCIMCRRCGVGVGGPCELPCKNGHDMCLAAVPAAVQGHLPVPATAAAGQKSHCTVRSTLNVLCAACRDAAFLCANRNLPSFLPFFLDVCSSDVLR